MYADDTSLCHISSDISKLESAINEDLELSDNWLKGNKLSLNVAKTEVYAHLYKIKAENSQQQ